MSDVYSVEEPAGLALPLWFTLGHFGLQEFEKKLKNKKNHVVLLSSSACRGELTSGSTRATAAHVRTATL